MMEGFSEDMLNLALIKAQKFSLSLVDFSLSNVMKYIVETFSMKAATKGITLNFMFAKTLSLPIPS